MAPVAKSAMLMRRPAAEVFEALVELSVTMKFWFTKSTGRLDEHDRVRWTREMYGAQPDALVS